MLTTFIRNSARPVYLLGIAICLVPGVTPAVALSLGIIYALTWENPWPHYSAAGSRILLQSAVVGLGFGLPLTQVWEVGRNSFSATLGGIVITLTLGYLLGRMLNIPPCTSVLVSCGTAICGGSAIAAIAPIVQAKNDESAIALATVFTLNAVALLLFPVLGHFIGMGQEQFGTWAGMAIHDTSSVVGAAAAYGDSALQQATMVKLTRALWIVPLALAASALSKTGGRARVPLFILLFIAAAALHSLVPQAQPLWNWINRGAKVLLVMSLFFVGSGLTRSMLRQVGMRTFMQGLALWVAISTLTLGGILAGII